MLALDHVVEAILGSTLDGNDEKLPQLRSLVQALANHEQRTVLYAILRIVAKTLRPATDDGKRIAGIAALLKAFVEESPYLLEALLDWLTSLDGGAAGSNRPTRRAAVATLSMFPGQSFHGSLKFLLIPDRNLPKSIHKSIKAFWRQALHQTYTSIEPRK